MPPPQNRPHYLLRCRWLLISKIHGDFFLHSRPTHIQLCTDPPSCRWNYRTHTPATHPTCRSLKLPAAMPSLYTPNPRQGHNLQDSHTPCLSPVFGHKLGLWGRGCRRSSSGWMAAACCSSEDPWCQIRFPPPLSDGKHHLMCTSSWRFVTGRGGHNLYDSSRSAADPPKKLFQDVRDHMHSRCPSCAWLQEPLPFAVSEINVFSFGSNDVSLA